MNPQCDKFGHVWLFGQSGIYRLRSCKNCSRKQIFFQNHWQLQEPEEKPQPPKKPLPGQIDLFGEVH